MIFPTTRASTESQLHTTAAICASAICASLRRLESSDHRVGPPLLLSRYNTVVGFYAVCTQDIERKCRSGPISTATACLEQDHYHAAFSTL